MGNISIPSLVLYISIILITLIFYKIGIKSRTKKSSGKLPPEPWKLPLIGNSGGRRKNIDTPLIGNLHHLVGAVPHRALHRLAEKHGPVMGLSLGEVSAVVVSSADAAKEFLKTHDINFASRPIETIADILFYGSTSISSSPYGDYWRQLRMICTLELLSSKRVQSFRPLRERVFGDLLRRIADVEGSEVNFSEEFNSATYEIITKAALGEETKQLVTLQSLMNETSSLPVGFDLAELFPSVKLFWLMSGLRRKVVDLHKRIDDILEDILRQHRIGKEGEHEDLLDVLLKYQKDGLTIDNIKSVVDMLVAGTETSSSAVEWAMSEMLRNPRILGKAQEEVRQVFDQEGTIDESCIPECKYLKAIVKETLRMHPPGPVLPRKPAETRVVDGYEIAVGTKVFINVWAINRDPKYWEDADCFKPERFMDSLVDWRGNSFEFIPFGAGRRICPGITFGLANVELPLAMLLYHFDWKLGGGIKPQELDMQDGFGVTTTKLKNLLVIPINRRPLPTK